MKKKIICLSAVIVGILLVLGSLSPAVCSKDLETVTIETNLYYGKNSKTISNEVTIEEAQEIKQLLINLNQAIETNDEVAIAKYEAILNEKGIFGEKRQEFISQETFSDKMNLNKYSKYIKQSAGEDIANKLCYFNAIGTGGIFFTLAVRFIEVMQEIINNASTFIEAMVLLLILIPFFAIIYLFTHLIPFRILMPIGIVSMQKGKMFSLGLQGFKRVSYDNETDTYNVNISWFTGATVNFISEGELGGFLFVSGFAADVRETNT